MIADTVLNNSITNLEANLTHQINDAKTACNTYTDTIYLLYINKDYCDLKQ